MTALDERWIQDLADKPLLARVERKGDELAVAFYAREKPEADAGMPKFAEVARFAVPMARQLDAVREQVLGPAGPVLAVTAHADDPDEEPVVLTLIGRGPKLLFQASFLRDSNPAGASLALGPPEGFSMEADGGSASVNALSETKRVDVGFSDGGKGQVSLGGRERSWRWQDGKFVAASDGYRDFLSPMKLTASGHARLVDGAPTTSERLGKGKAIDVQLPAGAKVRVLRVVPGCLESEAKSHREPAVTAFTAQLDDAAPIRVDMGKPVNDPQLFGAGSFTLGKGYGESEMLFFEPPVPASKLRITIDAAERGAKSGCLAEIAAY